MPTDQLVTARHVLRATQDLQRRRSRRVLPELERLEPDLAEYLIENLSQLHHRLTHGLPSREARRVYRFAETTLLVSLMALQKGYRALLNGDDADGGDGGPFKPQSPSEPLGPIE